MSQQDYSNHRRWLPSYHFFLTLLLIAVLAGACFNLYKASDSGWLEAMLLLGMAVAISIIFFQARTFALKAQDRAIRAEENLRHFVLRGSLLDPRITTRQVVGLRFAPDDELAALADRAAEEGLSEDDIKKAIKNWKADEYRV